MEILHYKVFKNKGLVHFKAKHKYTKVVIAIGYFLHNEYSYPLNN